MNVRLLQLTIMLIHERVSESRLAGLHIDDRLVRVLHWTCLHRCLDLLVHSQLQHLLDLGWRADHRATEFDRFANESTCAELRQFIFGSADHDEGTLHAEKLEVVVQGQTWVIDGANDEVECAGVCAGPVWA